MIFLQILELLSDLLVNYIQLSWAHYKVANSNETIYLPFFYGCISLSSLNAYGSDHLAYPAIDSGTPLTAITVEALLDEIKNVQNELDELTSAGRLSSSAALAASAFLAVIVYNAVQYSEIYTPFFGSLEYYIKTGSTYELSKMLVVFREGIKSSIWTALKLAGLVGVSNFIDTDGLPNLHYKDSVKIGLQALLTGLGLGFFLSPSSDRFTPQLPEDTNIYKQAKVNFTGIVNLLTAYRLYAYIMQTRQDRQDDILNLQNRLRDARLQLEALNSSG